MYSAIVAWFQASPFPWLGLLVPKPGILYAVVLLACGAIFVRRAARSGIASDRALEALLATAVGALIGIRVFYLVTRTRFWEMGFLQLIDGRLGTASWGGYLGGFIGLILYALWRKYPVLSLTDTATSVAPLGCAIGRWNCFIAGDDFGRVTTWAWGIRYPARSLPWHAHRRSGLVELDTPWSLPVHPNQLVQSAVSFIVFVIVSRYWYRHRDQPGRTTALFLMLYGAGRFFVEFLRDPSAGGAVGLLSHSQYMCLAFVASGAALWGWQARRATAVPGAAHAP
jgi:phosphatidylglycerol:prolipoprotein diacylglycerol transferase